MKKMLVFYLIICLFIGLLPNQVMAQNKSDNNSIYNFEDYNNDKFKYYKKIMNGDVWNNYLKRDSSFAYVNFKNNQEDNIALSIATNITRDVTLVDALLPGFDGDNAKVEYYEIALSSLLVTLEDNLSADINKQSGADSIKSDIDILLEGGMALSGLLSELSSDLALALNSSGYNTVSEAFKLSNIQLNSMDIVINDFSEYIELNKFSAIYVKYHNLLNVIINQSDDELLVRAAKNISEITNYCYKYRLDNFSSLMKDVAKLESGHFFDVIDSVIKDNSTTPKELLGGMNIINNVTTLYGSLNLGVESGVFIGDALVGDSNIILRNYEMCAMALVRESIINEIEENNRKISSPDDIQSIDYVMDLLVSLLYVNVRGEYCCYSLLSKDARLLSLVNYNVNGKKMKIIINYLRV